MAASSENTQFNYRTTKRTFEMMQDNYIEKKREALVNGSLQLWSRERVDAYINVIEEHKFNGQKDIAQDIIDSYHLAAVDGVPKLAIKSRTHNGTPVVVIPMEDCFDVILKVHRRLGHRGPKMKMIKHVRKRYVIDKIWIILLLRSCNFCQNSANFEVPKQENLLPKKYHLRSRIYQLFICPMDSVDKDFHEILIMVDKMTNFIHLRPLAMTNYDVGLSVEVFKILADFGVPKIIETADMRLCLLIRTTIKDIMPKMDVPVHLTLAWTGFPMPLVKAQLAEWMKVNDSTHWTSGVPLVQWQINNTKYGSNTTPYEEVFYTAPVREIL